MRFNRLLRPLLLAALMLALGSASFAGVFVSVTVAPPPLPVYVQPPCPAPGYIWSPGYWAWDDDGYYWVPGTWVPAPAPGLLWTPGYWGWNDGFYVWNAGYWGPHVGYYGGINYGFGYFGVGFVGGEWHGDRFFYNRAVVNVDNRRITNVYVNKTVIVNNYYNRENHVSYNGPGGIQRQPDQREQMWSRERHIAPTSMQMQHIQAARQNPQLLARNNAGRPPVAATVKPADFNSRAVVPARAAGGRIDPNVLRATPRTMPQGPARNPGFGGNRPDRGAPNAGNRGTPGNMNRPEPGTRGATTFGSPNNPANRNVPRSPSAAPGFGANERRPRPEANTRAPFGATNRPAPSERTPSARPMPQSRPAPAERDFNRPPERGFNNSRPEPRMERPAPSRPQFSEPRMQPRPESRPAPPPRAEFRPAPQPRPERPAPQMRQAPQPRPERAPAQRGGPPQRDSNEHQR
jgi:YXWGXW repeat-containing protein